MIQHKQIEIIINIRLQYRMYLAPFMCVIVRGWTVAGGFLIEQIDMFYWRARQDPNLESSDLRPCHPSKPAYFVSISLA